MRHLISSFAGALALATTVVAAQSQTIGIVAPLSGTVAPLGEQMRQGAGVAAAERGMAAGNLRTADDECTAEGGEAAAHDMVKAGVSIVVGFLCTEAIEAALPILKEAAIPVITPGVRTDSLTDRRDRTGWLVFRTAPRADGEQRAVADILVPRWRRELFAIVDDGTIYGREFVESFRLAAETAGLKAVFLDTYRPQLDNQIGLVGRLRRAGATHVLVGGDRADVAIMGRDAAELDYDLVIAAGENLRAPADDVPLAAGTLMIGLHEPAGIAESSAIEAFARHGLVAEGYMLPTFAAFEIAALALAEAANSARELADILSTGTFETALGTITFDDKGDLAANPYRLFRYDGEAFVETE